MTTWTKGLIAGLAISAAALVSGPHEATARDGSVQYRDPGEGYQCWVDVSQHSVRGERSCQAWLDLAMDYLILKREKCQASITAQEKKGLLTPKRELDQYRQLGEDIVKLTKAYEQSGVEMTTGQVDYLKRRPIITDINGMLITVYTPPDYNKLSSSDLGSSQNKLTDRKKGDNGSSTTNQKSEAAKTTLGALVKAHKDLNKGFEIMNTKAQSPTVTLNLRNLITAASLLDNRAAKMGVGPDSKGTQQSAVSSGVQRPAAAIAGIPKITIEVNPTARAAILPNAQTKPVGGQKVLAAASQMSGRGSTLQMRTQGATGWIFSPVASPAVSTPVATQVKPQKPGRTVAEISIPIPRPASTAVTAPSGPAMQARPARVQPMSRPMTVGRGR